MNNQKPRILLIEDNPELAQSTQMLLDHFGYDVHWSASSQEAFAEIAHDGYRAALLDLNLGAESGVSLVCSLRQAGHHVPPLVIVSAQTSESIRKAAKQTGAVAVLQKPYTVEALTVAINKAMARPGSHADMND